MLTAINEAEVQVEAGDAASGQNYMCPECRGRVDLCSGAIKVPYFKHRAAHGCIFGMGETEEHRSAKLAIRNALRACDSVTASDVEATITIAGNRVRPDVRFVNATSPKTLYGAIEIQRSPLTPDIIAQRTAVYTAMAKGKSHPLGVLWLVLWTQYERRRRPDGLYRLTAWEKWLHAVYKGRVYYWVKDRIIRPVHFKPEPNDNGSFPKMIRRPMVGSDVDIATMRVREEHEFENIPQRFILLDTNKKWW